MPYIQKRLYYFFTAYGAECYSPEQVILQDELYNYFKGYVGCVFKDFHEYKIISEHPYKKYMYIYMPVFFNFPKTLSYRVVCKLISSILKFLWSDKMSGYLEFHGIVFRTKYCLYYIYK